MKKLYFPLMFDETTFTDGRAGPHIIPGHDSWPAFYSMDSAREHAKNLSLKNPKGKVVIFEAVAVVEPRKVEFAEKSYNASGELIA